MKVISTTLFIGSMSVSTVSLADCPLRLPVDDIIECVMVEGSGDIDYQEWASEFYKDTDPDKLAAIRAAYSEEEKVVVRNKRTAFVSK